MSECQSPYECPKCDRDVEGETLIRPSTDDPDWPWEIIHEKCGTRVGELGRPIEAGSETALICPECQTFAATGDDLAASMGLLGEHMNAAHP